MWNEDELTDINEHEKVCPERTVTSPCCEEEIQMKMFDKHAVENGCADTFNIIDEDDCRDDNMVMEKWS